MILYMGIVLYAPAIALEAVTGMSRESAILSIGSLFAVAPIILETNIIILLFVGIVCTFYSTIGGMKAVIITDVFQSMLMFAAVFSVIICAAIKAGGLGPIWQTAVDGGRINFLRYNLQT